MTLVIFSFTELTFIISTTLLSPPIISDLLSIKSSITSLQNWNESHAVQWWIWCSFWIAWDGTLCIMSNVKSIISSRVSLLLVNHEECLRLHVVLHHSPPFLHLHWYSSMTLSLLRRHMLLPHMGQNISPFSSPHSCKNFTPFLWSKNKNPKNILFSKSWDPTTLCRRIPLGQKASS